MFKSPRFIKYTAAIAILLFLSAGSLAAQSGMGAVSGWVIDVDHTAAVKDRKFLGIPGARVEIGGRSLKTDKNGAYDSGELQDGNYRLKISAPGYNDYELSIYIGSDEIVTVSVLLVKPKK